MCNKAFAKYVHELSVYQKQPCIIEFPLWPLTVNVLTTFVNKSENWLCSIPVHYSSFLMDLTSHVADLITQVCNKAVFMVKVP